MFRVLCVCAAVLLCGRCVPADEAATKNPLLLRYTAVLSQAAANGTSQPVRDFEIRCLVSPQPTGFPVILYLMDQPSDEQPWYEQFGRVEFDAEGLASPALPQQRHLHEGHNSWVGLRFGVYPGYAKLQLGAEWTEGTLKYRLLGEKPVNSQLCWQLEINGPQGRRTTLSIQKSNGAIQAADHRYFVGMGERFDLNLRLEEINSPEPSILTTWNQAASPLLKLKHELRGELTENVSDLSPKQLGLANQSLEAIDKAADGTPFAGLAGVIRREVTSGLQRDEAVADLATRFVGRPAPPISLIPLDGGPPIPLSKPDQVTVLHFWEYQEKPLAEPYGQVGYLDFLAQKRKGQVQVIGVISDKRLQDPGTESSALRSARKLREFMNIGYPLARETEGALSTFGDPRKFGVELPLWIVIGTDGTILHYRVGYYAVDSNRGLEELDGVIEKALSAK